MSPFLCRPSLLVILVLLSRTAAFTLPTTRRLPSSRSRIVNFAESEDNEQEDAASSLQSKMNSWEATEEEKNAATLGGLTPGNMDGFDLGLAIAFPFIVGTCALFILFPLYAPELSAGSGPPPF